MSYKAVSEKSRCNRADSFLNKSELTHHGIRKSEEEIRELCEDEEEMDLDESRS